MYTNNPVCIAIIVFAFFAGLDGFPQQLFESTRCHNNGSAGVCTRVYNCPIALESIRVTGKTSLRRCGFDGVVEIVCCPETTSLQDRSPTQSSTSIKEQTNIGHLEQPRARKSKKACDRYKQELPIVLSYQIVEGKDANIGEFPHMAALGFWNEQEQVYQFDCGGTLISEYYVVTAAHCLINIQRNVLKIVRLGIVNLPATVEKPDPKVDYNVVEKKFHEEYDWKKKFNDIALVKLEKVTFTDNIRPACLYTKNDDPVNVVVTGWGTVSSGGEKSTILQKATLTPVPLDQCNSTYMQRDKKTITKNQICATDDRSSACQGDSGGPLQVQTYSSMSTLVGVSSYGIGCGSKYPGIYTRIYSYLTWIESIVWP